MKFSIRACTPTLRNHFCGKKSQLNNWKTLRSCKKIPSTKDLIACPVFPRMFKSYDEFANWKNQSLIYEIYGKDHVVMKKLKTKGIFITPLFRCPKIKLVKPNHDMFI